MKKKFSLFIILVIIMAGAFFYSFVDRDVAIYDEQIESENYINTDEIVENTKVVQQFVSKYDEIRAVKIRIANFDREATGIIYYRIVEIDNSEILAEGSFAIAQLENNAFIELKFDTAKGCKNKRLSIEFADDNVERNSGISFYKTEGQSDNSELKINGVSGGTLVMKTVSHFFDLETFAVLIFFVLYFIAFIKLLYRFFK